MNEDASIVAALRALVLDNPDKGLTAVTFEQNPEVWKRAAEDWSISTIPLRSDPDAAQADAEACRDALAAAGWSDQATAEVGAHHIDGEGWRGMVNMNFGLLDAPDAVRVVPYLPVDDSR